MQMGEEKMSRNRMEAFSDGVLAIIITIMVLKLKVPSEPTWIAIREIIPTLVAYLLSYAYVAIYWMNHHHLLSAVHQVNARILWKNMFWLFWMSLIPFTTEWIDQHLDKGPATFFYGLVLLLCAVAYICLQNEIVRSHGENSTLASMIGRDYKGKFSILAYVIATVIAIWFPIPAYVIFALVAILWFIPDRRLEKHKQITEPKNL